MPPPARIRAFQLVVLSLLAALSSARAQPTRAAAAPLPGPPRVVAGTATSAPPPVPAASARFGWRSPVDGPLRVTRRFQAPAGPYGPGHRGVDLAASPGAPVLAARAGVVTYAGQLAGRGVVAVSHGALRTTYEPVEPIVHVGEEVLAGQPIGRLRPGHQGCPVVACLHWGLLRGASYLDPLAALGLGPPRLLPLGGAGDRLQQRRHLGTLSSSTAPARRTPAADGAPGWMRSAAAGGAGAGVVAAAIVATRRRSPGPVRRRAA